MKKIKFILDIENKLSNFRYDEIDHEQFLNKLILLKNNNFHNYFEISVLDNNTIYYKVSNNNQKTKIWHDYSMIILYIYILTMIFLLIYLISNSLIKYL